MDKRNPRRVDKKSSIEQNGLKTGKFRKKARCHGFRIPRFNITNYEKIINGLSLPDPKDRHILAAAIRINANVIVTFNLKDFPLDYLKFYDMEAQHPDEFITNLISIDKSKTLQALKNQVKGLKNPPKQLNDVLEALEKCGLRNSVNYLRN